MQDSETNQTESPQLSESVTNNAFETIEKMMVGDGKLANSFMITEVGQTRVQEPQDIDEKYTASGRLPDDSKALSQEVEDTPAYSDEELAQALKDYQKKKQLPQVLMRDAFLDYVKRLSVDALIAEDYDLAASYNGLITEVQNAFNQDNGSFESTRIVSSLNTRLLTVNTQKSDVENRWNEKIKELQAIEKNKLDSLLQKHQEEIDSYEKQCQTTEFLQKFSKPSAQLLQMKNIQKSLAIAGDFEAAKSMKAKADAQQLVETQEAQRKAYEAIKQGYLQLTERQQKEVECLQQNSLRKLKTAEADRDKEISAIEKLQKRINYRIQDVQHKKTSNLPPLVSSTPPRSTSHSANRQIAKFRRAPEQTQLTVQITDIKSIINSSKLKKEKPRL